MALLRANPDDSGLRARMAGQAYAADGEDTIVKAQAKPTRNATPAVLAQEARFTEGFRRLERPVRFRPRVVG